jgi:hypothetical protein
VIKQNTGGGKTVVGLLVAQSSLNEGVGPAAYVVPDTTSSTRCATKPTVSGWRCAASDPLLGLVGEVRDHRHRDRLDAEPRRLPGHVLLLAAGR